MDANEFPITYSTNRIIVGIKLFFLLLIFIMLVFSVEYKHASDLIFIFFIIAFFIFFILPYLITVLVNRPTLRIDEEGIKYQSYYKKMNYRWKDIGYIVHFSDNKGNNFILANSEQTHRAFMNSNLQYEIDLDVAEIKISIDEFSITKNDQTLEHFLERLNGLRKIYGHSHDNAPENSDVIIKNFEKKISKKKIEGYISLIFFLIIIAYFSLEKLGMF